MDESRTGETLMLAYRDGEMAAFEALYARHRARLFRYLLHQCGRREQADEMFQEIRMSMTRFAAQIAAIQFVNLPRGYPRQNVSV